MARSRSVLPLLAAALVCGAFAPRAAAASDFGPVWDLSGWTYVVSLGNTDGDPQPELLFHSNADGHYALFDGASGALQQEFPEFDYPNCNVVSIDVDDDGAPDLMFSGGYSGPALCKVYSWNGSGYSLLFQHTERFDGAGMAPVRSASQPDLLEFAADELRVRDATGTVVWRSTQLGPGLGTYAYGVNIDLNADGIEELLVVGQDASYQCRMVKYTGAAFVSQWNVTGWGPLFVASTQNTPAYQIGMVNFADGHYGMFEALTGAQVGDFPGISTYDGAAFFPVMLNPGSGRTDLLLWQPPVTGPPPVSPKFRAYRWGGAGYDLFISHTDPITIFSNASFRNSNTSEIVEVDQDAGDVRIRDDGGNVLFRASTDIPGWTNGPKPGLYAGAIELVHDGSSLPRVVIDDYPNATRLVSYAGTFSQTWAANGWHLGSNIGNADGDPQDELLLVNASDQTFGVVDGLTGTLAFNPPTWTQEHSSFEAYDADGDGRKELLLYRFNFSPGDPAPLMEQFRWDGGGYASMFQVTDSLVGLSAVQMIAPTVHEIFEVSPSGDLVLRHAVTGQQLFRASTDIVGWVPLDLTSGTPWRFGDFDGDGVNEMLIDNGLETFLLGFTGTTSVTGPGGPALLHLLPSLPNPFRSGTSLRFQLPHAGRADLRIFDASGRLVRRISRVLPAGANSIDWDGRDDAGNAVANGMLFWEVAAGGVRKAGKVVKVR